MMADAETVLEELAKIKSSDKQRRLKAESVVEYARRNKGSALHSKFNWDDTEAAELYRISQARNLIRVYVTVLPSESVSRTVEVSQYVSLSDSRGEGYESIVDVIDDPSRSEVLLHDVIKRLLGIKEVALFKELTAVHRAILKAAELYMPPSREEDEAA